MSSFSEKVMKALKKEIVTAALSAIQRSTVDTTSTTIAFNTTTNNISKNEKLTLSAGNITVGKNTKKIIISANFGGYLTAAQTSGYMRLDLYKNSTRVKSARKDLKISRRIDMSLTDIVLDVTENDTISLKLYSTVSLTTSIENDVTYLTVKEV